jgi:hypothetical protein
MKCPLCSGKLKQQEIQMNVVDAIKIFQCDLDDNHKFWIHPFDHNHINFDSNICLENANQGKTIKKWRILSKNKFKEIKKFKENE